MSLDSDVQSIESELQKLLSPEDFTVRTALYRNLATLRFLNWVGGDDGGIGPLIKEEITYLGDTTHTLTIPDNTNYAELYFEASDYDEPIRVARLTLGEDPPTSGVGANQRGRIVRNEDILKYSRLDELQRMKIIKFPSINNLRLEVNFYA